MTRRGSASARHDKILAVAAPLIVAILGGLAWQLYADHKNNAVVPRSTAVMSAFVGLLHRGSIWSALWSTDSTLLIGYAIAVVVAVPLGLLLGRYRWLHSASAPLFDILMVIPMAAFMPVLLFTLGLNRSAQIVIIIVFALPYIAIASRNGAALVPGELISMSRAFQANELQIWRTIVVPSARADILTGLRVGFGQAISGIVVVELTLLALGIGKVVLDFQATFDYANLFAFVMLLSLQCVAAMSVLHVLESRSRLSALSRREA